MKKIVCILTLLCASAQAQTSDSLIIMSDLFQRMGPNGPTFILKHYAPLLDDEPTTSMTEGEKYNALRNMVDFVTDTPMDPLNSVIPDYKAFAKLSRKERNILRHVSYVVLELEQQYTRMRLNGLGTGPVGSVVRVSWK